MKKSKGFTLIEMLVVIGVIGLLAAILMPTLAIARRKMRETATRAEIQAIETAAAMFRSDTGMFPPDLYYRQNDMRGVRPVFGAIRYLNEFQHQNITDPTTLWQNDSTITLVFFLGSSFWVDGKRYGPYMNFNLGDLIAFDWSQSVTRWPSGFGHRVTVYGITAPGDLEADRRVRLRCLLDKFGSTFVYDCHAPEGVEIQRGLGGVPHNLNSFDLWSLGYDRSAYMTGRSGRPSDPDMGLAATPQQEATARMYGNDIVNWTVSRWGGG